MDAFKANPQRYDSLMTYKKCGNCGLKLPLISLGLWHNFGGMDLLDNQKELIRTAFNAGITHFDLANNYGPPPGSAEKNFGRLLKSDLKNHRDECVISTKAGYGMWEGPYGDWGSRKYLISSLDQSLQRMNLDYVDIFYHHRPDPETPLEETMGALDQIVRSGKALYVGISNYSAELGLQAQKILKDLGTPSIIHQLRYNLLDRAAEARVLPELEKAGMGSIVFSPLAQGILSDRYLKCIPANSRASKVNFPDLNKTFIEDRLPLINQLNALANKRSQSLAQMALAWCLRRPEVTSVLIGASSAEQLKANIDSLNNLSFSEDCLQSIDKLLSQEAH